MLFWSEPMSNYLLPKQRQCGRKSRIGTVLGGLYFQPKMKSCIRWFCPCWRDRLLASYFRTAREAGCKPVVRKGSLSSILRLATIQEEGNGLYSQEDSSARIPSSL